MKINFNARNHSELFCQLKKLGVSVPPRSSGRTKEHTENWIGLRLLIALSKINRLDFPISVVHEDRPDLRIKTSKDSIGLELSEVVPTEYANAVSIRNKHYPNRPVDRKTFSGDKNFSKADIHDHFKNLGKTSKETPWLENSVERDWANLVNASILKKQMLSIKKALNCFHITGLDFIQVQLDRC